MKHLPVNFQLLLPLGLLVFLAGMLTYGAVSGQLTGRADAEADAQLERAYQRGFQEGFSRGAGSAPRLVSEQVVLTLGATHTFLASLEVEFTAMAEDQAIDLSYSEPRRPRRLAIGLAPGTGIVFRANGVIYLIEYPAPASDGAGVTVAVSVITPPP